MFNWDTYSNKAFTKYNFDLMAHFIQLYCINCIVSRRSRRRSRCESLKATSHSTIFDIPTPPIHEDQRHRRRFTR